VAAGQTFVQPLAVRDAVKIASNATALPFRQSGMRAADE
jgi:hypothetical protein